MDEYKSNAFNGAMKGHLLMQDWKGTLYHMTLKDDGDYDSMAAVPNGKILILLIQIGLYMISDSLHIIGHVLLSLV